MISDATVGYTLVDIVVADCRDLVEIAARHDLVGATNAKEGNPLSGSRS